MTRRDGADGEGDKPQPAKAGDEPAGRPLVGGATVALGDDQRAAIVAARKATPFREGSADDTSAPPLAQDLYGQGGSGTAALGEDVRAAVMKRVARPVASAPGASPAATSPWAGGHMRPAPKPVITPSQPSTAQAVAPPARLDGDERATAAPTPEAPASSYASAENRMKALTLTKLMTTDDADLRALCGRFDGMLELEDARVMRDILHQLAAMLSGGGGASGEPLQRAREVLATSPTQPRSPNNASD